MDHGHVGDADLVRRARRGDGDAFGALVRRYLRPALAVAWEIVESREDAEDIVQEAFYRALRALDRFEADRPFGPWIFTIVRNLGRNAIKRRGRWKLVQLPRSLPGRGAGDGAERSEVRERVEVALGRLSEKQRACFRLCEIEGFGRSEVAQMLGLSESTVRVHLHRARAALKDELRELAPETTAEGPEAFEERMAT